MLILPSILPVPDSPRTLPSNTYIDGTKPDGQSVTRATVSLDLMLEEFALLDSHVAAAKSAFTTMCSQPAASTSAFNLVDLVTTGAADRIQSLLSKHPMEFGLQVRSLASSTPVMLLHLTRLRMLCRWMRTTWGPSTPFATLYHNVFNHAYSIHALGLDITSVVRSSSLDEIYGRGWYNHRKGFQRVDLDIAAKENAIAQPFTLSPSPLHARPAGVNKRQCIPPPTLPRWTRVPRGHGAVSRSGASASPQRPWQSPNMFDALREHIVVTPTQLVDSSTNNMLILPSILPVPDSPRTLPSNTYIDGTKPDGQSVTLGVYDDVFPTCRLHLGLQPR
ncbi:hypothetical protein H257_10649 [Aphanomyces astaci]|uniref:Uncharacterized protein n=1 Tax=Aphanomyces astaci TaxID=112090 RepID=W4G5W8_APHAT|nr:hypothetical protein H257_10649 [Aphanomyces astaci]ETV75050.1 hypothetical protein H257_10649 [Aphanomyces astaci]|eukprot:XP_009835554.1 hypothetical protein H257_10649 [Aphanomyces astaci]